MSNRSWSKFLLPMLILWGSLIRREWEQFNDCGCGYDLAEVGLLGLIIGCCILAFLVLRERRARRPVMSPLFVAAVSSALAVWLWLYPVRYAWLAHECWSGDFESCREPHAFVDGWAPKVELWGAESLVLPREEGNALFTPPNVRVGDMKPDFVMHECLSFRRTRYCRMALERGYPRPNALCQSTPVEDAAEVWRFCEVAPGGRRLRHVSEWTKQIHF